MLCHGWHAAKHGTTFEKVEPVTPVQSLEGLAACLPDTTLHTERDLKSFC